jgi:hypothetical protein
MSEASAATEGSITAPSSASSDSGFRKSRKSAPSPASAAAPSGSATSKSRSYRRSWHGTAWAAETHWIVPFTFLPSGVVPPRLSGS